MAKLNTLLLLGGAAVAAIALSSKPKKKSNGEGEELPKPPARGSGEKKDEPAEEPADEPAEEPADEPEEPQAPPKPNGPSGAGTTVSGVYTPAPEYISPEVANQLSDSILTAYPEKDWYLYARRHVQEKLFNALVNRYRKIEEGLEAPTLSSVVVREELNNINSGTAWEGPISALHPAAQKFFESVKFLDKIAKQHTGFKDPLPSHINLFGKTLHTITRGALGLKSDSAKNINMDQRVEIIATDKSLQNAEHLIGRVVDLAPNDNDDKFRIEIVGVFQGQDVKPDLTSKHHWKVGQKASFDKTAPTGIYRIFPTNMK